MSTAPRIDDVMLMAYVDGEVDAATAREIEGAIAGDPSVAARVRALRATAALARSAYAGVLHEPVPERLIAALQAPAAAAAATPEGAVVVAMRPRAARPASGWRTAGWAVAAAIAAVALFAAGSRTGLVQVGPPAPTVQLAADTDRWLDNLAAFYREYDGTLQKEQRLLVDFGAEHIGELENWFSSRLNRRIAVPDLSPFGFQPQGGRLLIIGGKPAAQFLYAGEGNALIGLVVALTQEPQRGGRLDAREDVNIVHWRENGYAYAFVGKIDGQRLWRMADLTWSALKPI